MKTYASMGYSEVPWIYYGFSRKAIVDRGVCWGVCWVGDEWAFGWMPACAGMTAA
jgi:hypothetical protein